MLGTGVGCRQGAQTPGEGAQQRLHTSHWYKGNVNQVTSPHVHIYAVYLPVPLSSQGLGTVAWLLVTSKCRISWILAAHPRVGLVTRSVLNSYPRLLMRMALPQETPAFPDGPGSGPQTSQGSKNPQDG
jgi:hypothetical protein